MRTISLFYFIYRILSLIFLIGGSVYLVQEYNWSKWTILLAIILFSVIPITIEFKGKK